MRQKASTVGNLVNKDVPVSMNEVNTLISFLYVKVLREPPSQDDNKTIRKWHPDGEGVEVEKKPDILAHHEVLLRLDAMDLERGPYRRPSKTHKPADSDGDRRKDYWP